MATEMVAPARGKVVHVAFTGAHRGRIDAPQLQPLCELRAAIEEMLELMSRWSKEPWDAARMEQYRQSAWRAAEWRRDAYLAHCRKSIDELQGKLARREARRSPRRVCADQA